MTYEELKAADELIDELEEQSPNGQNADLLCMLKQAILILLKDFQDRGMDCS